MAEKKKKKWAQKVDIKEGASKAMGWPSASAIVANVRSGKTSYATASRRMVYLANVSKDPATKKKARAIIVRLKNEFGKDKD